MVDGLPNAGMKDKGETDNKRKATIMVSYCKFITIS